MDLGNKIKRIKNDMIVKGNTAVADFISKLFESRTQAHILHLTTTSYAKHKALDDYYNDIVGFADDIAEAYQGKYGIIKGYNCGTINDSLDPISYLESIRTYVNTNRYTAFKQTDTNLQNIIDEVVTLLDSTLYKLKNLS